MPKSSYALLLTPLLALLILASCSSGPNGVSKADYDAASKGDVAACAKVGAHLYKEASAIPDARAAKARYEEAAKYLEKAAAGGDAGAQMALGSMYEFGHGVKQDLIAAARRYRIASDAGSVEGQRALAAFWCRMGTHLEDAEKLARKALAAEPDNAGCHETLGAILYSLGRPAEGEVEFEKAVKLDPDGRKGARAAAAEFHGARGGELMAAGDLNGALAEFEKALALDPSNVYALTLKGCAFQAKGDEAKALECFDKLAKLQPSSSSVFASRAELYKLNGDLEKAKADCRKAVELSPGDSALRASLGAALQASGDFKEALKCFDKAVELSPSSAGPLRQRALARAETGDYAGAEEDYGRIIKLDPSDAKALVARANVRCGIGLFKEAVEDCDKAIAMSPSDATAYVCRANAFMGLSEFAKAEADCDKALEIDPRLLFAYSMRGHARMEAGKLEPALKDLDEALKLDPDDEASLFAKASLLMKLCRPSEALEALKGSSVEANPGLLELRARAEMAAGSMDAAVSDASAALKLDEDNPERWVFKAYVELNAKRMKKAANDATRALELGSKSPWTRYVRGSARLKMGEPEKAARDFDALIEMVPDSPWNYQLRGAAKSLAGKHSEALKDFAKAYSMNEKSAAAALDLSEAMIMDGDAKGAGELAGKLLADGEASPQEKAIALYLQCCSGILLGTDVSAKLAAFNEAMKGDFDVGWLTEAFEKWLAASSVSKDAKARIAELTARMKARSKTD